MDNNIDDDFNKNITAMAFNTLTLTIAPTTTSSNFFYNNYSVEHFMTLNKLIPIKTAKNIVMSMNNNAFAYGLIGGIEPGGMEPGTVRRGDVGNKSSNDKGKSAIYLCDDNNDNNNPPDLPKFIVNINLNELVNMKNLIVDINFFDCHFNDNG